MRIVQLSDLHLSSNNINDLKLYYLDGLIADLADFHTQVPIDLILITGDLIDKGGSSLGSNPYTVFETEIITPIISALKISKQQVLIIPGNHDVDRNEIYEQSEFFLKHNLNREKANELVSGMKKGFTQDHSRIRRFKEFEREFHDSTPNYIYSNAESSIIIHTDQGDIGIALINDSWRCSSDLTRENHFVGSYQLFNTAKRFNEAKTKRNIAVFHHPLDAINEEEKEEMENILKAKNFSFALFGHSHKYKYQSLLSVTGGYVSINGRAALDNPDQPLANFQPGYNILDINLVSDTFELYARKFVRNGFTFQADMDSLPANKNSIGGKTSGIIPKIEYYQLAKDSTNQDSELPNGYTADVDRIVTLLIGKSIYPNPLIFIRELIQNSVDACNRLKELNTHATPKIIVNINRSENYIEFVDQGDGMSKSILKNHFSVIGKSISQEFNDNTGHFNLISQFGIGFISTFIIAQRVCVTTKRINEEVINFEVTNVFKGFEYSNKIHTELESESGTAIKVYLKKGNESQSLLSQIINYCRHIDNMEVSLDGAKIQLPDSWNTEECDFFFNEKNDRFDARIGIGKKSRKLYTSNSGFIINTHGINAYPFRFPGIIGGEVNFSPKAIDFDVSRNNLIDNEKSADFRKQISMSLRKLFRDTIESGSAELIERVVQYISYYIEYYDANNAKMTESYYDFYSKKELLDIFIKNSKFIYANGSTSLYHIFQELTRLGITAIYTVSGRKFEEHEEIAIEYLRANGNLVVDLSNFSVQFQDGGQNVDMLNVFHIIAAEYGFSIIDTLSIKEQILKGMKKDKGLQPPKLLENLSAIETKHGILIDIADFKNSIKPSIRYDNQFLINESHESFKSLLNQIEHFSSEKIDVYLLGLLGLQLS
jgi:predicted MPP superfamily phosphohydrolase